jgi:hypothetical protein
MNILGNEGNNPFDQNLNTTDAVDFTRVDVSDAIIDNSQLATKLYVDTHGGGGGGGNMKYVGTTPATNKIYKALASNGHDAIESSITDDGTNCIVNANVLKSYQLDSINSGISWTIGASAYQIVVPATNGIISNQFKKIGGIATEFLKADGTADTAHGMPVNSLFANSIALPTANRAYWFTAIVPYDTTINGFNIYCDSGGSDFCHFGIYRGYLKSGSGTNPGANITLAGQSASGIILTTGMPFNRVPVVAAVGQNLNFTAGEYMTIAFHTSGSSNVFLGTATGTLFVKLFYTTITNYHSTSFPATITQSAISVGFTQRPCFDLY